jgi:hypothetical protein
LEDFDDERVSRTYRWLSAFLLKEHFMFIYALVLAIVLGFPLSGFAQFVDRGEYVEVSKGVKLCSNGTLDTLNGMLDPEHRFWRVTSKARANGTQTVDAFVLERSYDRQSGETTVEERRYDDHYATLFKRTLEHKGMLLMVSPRDGQVEATVEICKKKK